MSTRYLAVDTTPGECTKYIETELIRRDYDFAVFGLRVSMLTLLFKFVTVIKFQ